LNVVQIEVPALRERPEDIHLLVDHFIRKYGTGKVTGIQEDALTVLEAYRWDGNIRELENVIQRAVILSTKPELQIQDLPPEIVAQSEERYKIRADLTLDEAEQDFRKWLIIRTLRKTNNNKAKAAELLGVNRSHFFKILNQLGIDG
jgi:DNA-binding NtrC family response regulator